MTVKNRWLLLIHQIPRTPSYLRVKTWRRLQRLGAVAIKNSVYATPAGEQALEDFVWVLREIEQGGGEASICEARFVEGLTDGQVEAMFRSARDEDYRSIAAEARQLNQRRKSGRDEKIEIAGVADEVNRLKKRLDDVIAIDFFGASSRGDALKSLGQLQRNAKEDAVLPSRAPLDFKGKTWVTRRDIFVDRMASAWLIKRFIDPKARFKFVTAKTHKARKSELRFDMFGGEFTHEGDRCTFEVLVQRTGLKDSGLTAISQIVHDIDVKDAKFGRAETAGIDRVLRGIAMSIRDDKNRLERSGPVFDDLYQFFNKKNRR